MDHFTILHYQTHPHSYSLILGFLDKREAHEMLLRCQPGTFIVRFTESEPGGVSIVWVKSKCVVCRVDVCLPLFSHPSCIINIHPPLDNIEKQVYDLAPWNRSSLQGMRSFADRYRSPLNCHHAVYTTAICCRVRDLTHLFMLYPNIQKDEAFGSYYTVQG